ncbi:Clathrin heavy chain linker domain-containing protein 1 [Boothiomyces macroporosus]|uniref:Clathrin heavy chain linker domain-containing protein 1 n=1 Tax=Boothiomyces macroporosus TaxID=261099 RepID=A0AAD5UE12_9FUNG|nr:Clathrin heavy chain linker domain-containing protein 1 [Boothiomyces macroporosus]KAJ3255498.1 Clathrin heavy chain linker domain-containing protein 1 [Boothiomyces macroporosus]
MDRYVAQQRKEVQDIASGYLSASQTNKILEERAKQQAGGPRFGPASKNILGEDNGIGIGVMHDILAEFDTVKKRTEITATPEKPKMEKHIPPLKKVSRKFVEPFQLHLTKIDQYKVVSETKSKLISDGIKIKYNDNAKQDKLKKFKEYIKTELAASGCPDRGPDIGRLRVHATCFEQIIQEFTTFGPLLAEIKAEYDKIINNYQEKEDEFTFLRTKVQKLISQNENRFLLRFEKQKCAELENRIQILESNQQPNIAENEKLKKDMIYKLTVYASYLPESILAQQRKTDPAFQNIEVQPFELGKDPLSLKDEAISERDKLIKEKMLEIQELRHIQETEFVPRITKEKIEENLRILEQKYKTFAEQNAQYEAELSEKKERVRTLENQLREKEQQYQFLYRNMIKNKLKKNEFELAIDEMADMVTNTKEYKLVMSDLRDLSQDTDFLIKEVGLGGLFAKKPSKSKIQAFTSILDSLCKLITQTKYETLPQTVKQALFNIVKNENIPVGYLWDNESVLQATKNEEAWTIMTLYFFFVKTLIFKVVFTGYREKSATEEHNLRAISYIFYKCIRDSSSDGVLEFEQQFKRGIQGWLGSSEIANQWDDTGCKLLYKTFEVYMGEMANNMFQWAALMIEKVAPKDTLANLETIAETNDSKLPSPDSDTKPKE